MHNVCGIEKMTYESMQCTLSGEFNVRCICAKILPRFFCHDQKEHASISKFRTEMAPTHAQGSKRWWIIWRFVCHIQDITTLGLGILLAKACTYERPIWCVLPPKKHHHWLPTHLLHLTLPPKIFNVSDQIPLTQLVEKFRQNYRSCL